jgi:uncharacterized membrane protein YagU involved in acid resistance
MKTKKPSSIVTSILAGAASGLLASLPMSVSMNIMHRLLPEEEKYPLPPTEITLAASERAGIGKVVREDPLKTTAVGAGHFSYGSMGGVIFALLSKKMLFPALLNGSLFALLYWAVGYMGWLPAAGILSPATKHPPRRTALSITAHLIYGIGTALIYNRLMRNTLK